MKARARVNAIVLAAVVSVARVSSDNLAAAAQTFHMVAPPVLNSSRAVADFRARNFCRWHPSAPPEEA